MIQSITKRLLLLFFILTLWIKPVIAQPNAGFEDWIPEFTYEVPESWQTFNFLSLSSPPNPISAFKAIGLDKHSGNYALKLKSVHLNNNVLPDTFQLGDLDVGDTLGGTFIGKINLSPVSFIYGFPYTERPAKLEFWAKYNPVGNDTAGALVFMKRSSNGLDSIGYAELKITATAVYTLFELPITYLSNEYPDSATIVFLSSRSGVTAREGSTLFVDDVKFTGSVGISQNGTIEPIVKVFPNPAKDNITFSINFDSADHVTIKDISGKNVLAGYLYDKKAHMNTSVLATGMYFYEIADKKNNVLKYGRFSITR